MLQDHRELFGRDGIATYSRDTLQVIHGRAERRAGALFGKHLQL